MMSRASELHEKFQTVGLQPSDRETLLQCIRDETDPVSLSGLLYMWGYTFPEHPEVLAVSLRFLSEPSPGTTATCLKLVCDYWGHWQEHEADLARFLDPSMYDEWYDEVIVAFSFVARHPYGWSRETLMRFAKVEREAGRLGLSDFK